MSRYIASTILAAALCLLPFAVSAQLPVGQAVEQELSVGAALDKGLEYIGEFRVISWNAAALDPKGGWNASAEVAPADVAAFILENASILDANVLALQEMSAEVYQHLVIGLGFNWDCYAAFIGLVDLRVTCVRGAGSNFRVRKLANHAEFGTDDYSVSLAGMEWWGYTQLDYLGVVITNVHTRSNWRNQHVAQLHAEVESGIVAGDFNHTQPELPDWYQTDPFGEATHRRRPCDGCPFDYDKIDHILTVEPHYEADGDVIGLGWLPEGGSNHKMIWARFRLHGEPGRASLAQPLYLEAQSLYLEAIR